MAYSSRYHWNCGRTQRKAATINQLACPSCSLYVQLLWYPMYYPGGVKARVSPVPWSKPYSILAPTQDSNPGGRIRNHKRWPLHYHWARHSSWIIFMKYSICDENIFFLELTRILFELSLVCVFDCWLGPLYITHLCLASTKVGQ